MLVLHAHWQPPRRVNDPGGLIFWAESSEAPPPERWHGRLPKQIPARVHPFALPPEVLRETIGAGTPLGAANTYRVRLRLPSTRTGPIPSPELRQDWELDLTPPFLAPWVVEGLFLAAATAYTVLVSLPDEGPDHSFVLGPDLRFWRKAANLVLETLASQKILPVLVAVKSQPEPERQPPSRTPREAGRRQNQPTQNTNGIVYQARWLAVLDGQNDGPRLAALIAAIPPICRAEAANGGGEITAGPLLDSFLKTMTDALARSWGKSSAPKMPPDGESPFRSWIEALYREDATVRASQAQLEALNSSLRAWMRNLQAAGDSVFRIAFRLEAPTGETRPDEKAWMLHFLLQARDDLSLLVSADDVWTQRGEALLAQGRRFEHPQDKLLAGLGYAARLYSPLVPGLQSSRPTGVSLTTGEAYSFLRNAGPLLQQAGFGLLAPPWWSRPGGGLGVRLRLNAPDRQPLSSSKLGMKQLVSYQWELALGETTLTEQEFHALAALKQPLVQIRGQWVHLDPEQIEAAIRFWESNQKSGELPLLQAAQYGLGGQPTASGLPVTEVVAEGWVADWLDRLRSTEKLSELQQPPGLHGELRPYQRFGFSWLSFFRRYGLGAILADDMGLGKTIQALALLLYEKETLGRLPGPVLLVCPTSVVTNWEREVRRFTPGLTTYIHQGPERLRNSDFKARVAQTDLILTSYAVLRQDGELLQGVRWYGAILDEAQNIKNSATKVTQSARKLEASFRFALTGTPVENRLQELWSIMHFLNPGYLGSAEAFRRDFTIPIERFGDKEATQRLKALVSPFLLRRVKTDPRVIQDLPEKLEIKQFCNLTEEQVTLYEAVVQTTLAKVAETTGIERKGLVLALLTHLKQICNHPVHYLKQGQAASKELAGRSGKLDRLVEMLDEVIAEGDRALVFTQYAEMGKLLADFLPRALGCGVLFLHGGTPLTMRDQMVRRFQEEENGPQVFLLSLKAGGTGLNLMRANHVFHFDRWWNPAVEDQATDRAYRIGQVRNVQVHKFITTGTLEEKIDDLIESKKGLAESVIGGGEEWLTELSTEEIRELVQLRR